MNPGEKFTVIWTENRTRLVDQIKLTNYNRTAVLADMLLH